MTDEEIARRLWREDPEDSFWLELLAALAAARADERERCAKLATDMLVMRSCTHNAHGIPDAIRALK